MKTIPQPIDGQREPTAKLAPDPKRWVPKAEYERVLTEIPPDPTFFADIAELAGHVEGVEDLDTPAL
jgi:hypothetical protein